MCKVWFFLKLLGNKFLNLLRFHQRLVHYRCVINICSLTEGLINSFKCISYKNFKSVSLFLKISGRQWENVNGIHNGNIKMAF